MFPDGKKVTSTKHLTIDERLYIALNRVYNTNTGKDGMQRKELAELFGMYPQRITDIANGRRKLKSARNIFRYLFKMTGLPYKDVDAPEPEHYHKDLPAALRKYKEKNNL